MIKSDEERFNAIEDFLWDRSAEGSTTAGPPDGPCLKQEIDQMRRIMRETLEILRETAPATQRDRICSLIFKLEQRQSRAHVAAMRQRMIAR